VVYCYINIGTIVVEKKRKEVNKNTVNPAHCVYFVQTTKRTLITFNWILVHILFWINQSNQLLLLTEKICFLDTLYKNEWKLLEKYKQKWFLDQNLKILVFLPWDSCSIYRMVGKTQFLLRPIISSTDCR
jgi:hypothetical protein